MDMTRTDLNRRVRRIIPGLLMAGLVLTLSNLLAIQPASARGGGGGGFHGGFHASIPFPSAPHPVPVFNPGVTPSAPGPSRISPDPRSSAGLATHVMPGPALGADSLPAGRARASRHQMNRDQNAINELNREIDRQLSICRGC
jgi:hypothetical protein